MYNILREADAKTSTFTFTLTLTLLLKAEHDAILQGASNLPEQLNSLESTLEHSL